MAIIKVARPKQVGWTAVSGQSPTPPTGPITSIQSATVQVTGEVADFLEGDARVQSHYAGTVSAVITIETSDIAKGSAFRVGQQFTNVILTQEAAISSGGITVGGNVTHTLSKAVVTEVGEIQAGNENSAPATISITFTLSRHPGDSADPTYALAEVGGGG